MSVSLTATITQATPAVIKTGYVDTLLSDACKLINAAKAGGANSTAIANWFGSSHGQDAAWFGSCMTRMYDYLDGKTSVALTLKPNVSGAGSCDVSNTTMAITLEKGCFSKRYSQGMRCVTMIHELTHKSPLFNTVTSYPSPFTIDVHTQETITNICKGTYDIKVQQKSYMAPEDPYGPTSVKDYALSNSNVIWNAENWAFYIASFRSTIHDLTISDWKYCDRKSLPSFTGGSLAEKDPDAYV